MRAKAGDTVRYADGVTALAKLVSPHPGGWHAEHCLGGILFISNFKQATTEDLLEAQKSSSYIWPRVLESELRERLLPVGSLHVTGTRHRHGEANALGVWVDVIVTDEAGVEWYFPASTFADDLRPNNLSCELKECNGVPHIRINHRIVLCEAHNREYNEYCKLMGAPEETGAITEFLSYKRRVS